ncbi:MAG: ribonuclease III [Alphaproteobacteria bacterium]
MARRPDIKHLQKQIGYQFGNNKLLHEALTHASAIYGQPGMADYERLEFLGDRVLGLAIAEYLLQAFPASPEGDLARRFNGLVRKETCAAVAEELDIGPFINLGESEAMAGGRRKRTILADACEALLGAIYLDGGWEPVKQFIIKHWGARLSEVATVPVDGKTALQEWVQGQGRTKLPRYVLVSNSGPDHAPEFEYEVQVTGYAPARGKGPSRRAAEQAAAAALLTREGVWKTANE